MSLKSILFFLVLALGTWRSAEAQRAAVFAEVSQRLKPGDTIFVTGRDSAETRGRLVRVSSTSLVMTVDGQEREILSTEIGWIERRGDRLWDGTVVGAAITGWAFAGGAGASCSPDCAKVVTGAALGGAAIGAGFGALFDALHRGRMLVHGTPPGVARKQLRQRPPAASLGDLWSRVRRGDTIYLREASGQETKGVFVRASVSSLTMVVDGQAREIPSRDVQRVQRRTSQLGPGLLFGPPLGAVVGALSPRKHFSRTESGVSGAVVGAALGIAVGSLLPRRSLLYQRGVQPAVSVMPVLAPGRRGAVLSVRFQTQ